MYISEALIVTLDSGESIPVLCRNLLVPPEDNESNNEYQEKLIECMARLNVPTANA
ncbi:MAG: hypothetical protein HRU20_10745 [Pseudomonadales bacterium]|nr:hypothetical protein [Pseudomonadales bacterium]